MDLIDRKEAKDMKFTHGINEDGLLYVPYIEVMNHLQGLPSVQVEPKQGEWVSHMVTQSGDYAGWHCSCCGTKFLSYRTCKYKYCPECGARMVETLPSAQPEQKWIPCSERLPEYMVPVLTWDGECFTVEQRISDVYDIGYGSESCWWVGVDYVEGSYDYPGLRDGAAIAWMPLPKPYRGEKNE